jgi:hypothetical protein
LEYNEVIDEYNLTRATKALFYDKKGKLKPEAEIFIAFLRDVCGARGELAINGSPFLYDREGRFDGGAAAFAMGKRRVFDLIVKHLSMNETQIFTLLSLADRRKSDLELIAEELTI